MELKKVDTIDDLKQIELLFASWNETMIWSCLQGHMGKATTSGKGPNSAMIEIGDFCFFAGEPSQELILNAKPPILVPQGTAWAKLIEKQFGKGVIQHTRYSIKKEPAAFCGKHLQSLVEELPEVYALRLIDEPMVEILMKSEWSRDLCGQFDSSKDFCKRGLGVVVVHHGRPVAGASSYTIYNGGIEVEIDTMPEYRRRGLATACGARLILECLDCGLYPSWDAHDLRSLALAEKLGYHRDGAYPVYVKKY